MSAVIQPAVFAKAMAKVAEDRAELLKGLAESDAPNRAEADAAIVTYLRTVAAQSGIAECWVNVFMDQEGAEFSASAPNLASPNGARLHAYGATADDAIRALRKKLPAAYDCAAALRLEAQRLAELAAKIEDRAP